MENFFIITPIGLEDISQQELSEKWKFFTEDPPMSFQKTKGGIQLQCPLNYGLALNHILRTPTRILLRLKTQKCRDLPKLYKILKKIEWKKFLCHEEVDFQISAKKSRIIHTGKMEKTATDALRDYFQANHIKAKTLEEYKDKPKPTLFLRLNEDELTISLDTTGERLHKRGQQLSLAKAPLRESTAQSLLRFLVDNIEETQQKTLIDPMCGSGTFLREALQANSLLNRDFAYNFLNITFKMPSITTKEKPLFQSTYGFDSNKELIENNKAINPKIHFAVKNLFQTNYPPELQGQIVIVNPPYGKRIKIQGPKHEFFQNIVQNIDNKLSPQVMGVIIPTPFEKGLVGEKLYFNQNGVKVCFLKRVKS